MASKALQNPIIRHVAKRGYAQAAPATKESRIQSGVSNKTFLAALDNGSPVTRVTVAFRAGSCYEPQTELGISHVLRSAAGLSTGNASGYILSRKLAQAGASVSASGDREFIYYTLEATQDKVLDALDELGNLISNQEFRPWELSDNNPRLRYDITALSPQVRAVDLLHRAAYRRGLGNSLFVSPKRIGKISSESLQHYVASNLTPSRCAVAVVGGNMDVANLIAGRLNLSSAEGKSEGSPYFGGELRKETGGELAHVALAVQGAAANTPQSLALAVAAKALGCGPVTKWGSDISVLGKAAGNIGPFAAAGFNVSYTDSGLFGVVLSVPKDEAKAAVSSVAKTLKNLSLGNEVVKAAKNQLKLQILSDGEDGALLSESLAAQGLYRGAAASPVELAAAVEQIQSNDVSQAVAAAVKSKLSMGAVGNLAFVPYADEV